MRPKSRDIAGVMVSRCPAWLHRMRFFSRPVRILAPANRQDADRLALFARHLRTISISLSFSPGAMRKVKPRDIEAGAHQLTEDDSLLQEDQGWHNLGRRRWSAGRLGSIRVKLIRPRTAFWSRRWPPISLILRALLGLGFSGLPIGVERRGHSNCETALCR